jgi:hypothetical protein
MVQMVQMVQMAVGRTHFAVGLKCSLLRAISLIYKRNLKITNHILAIVISLDVYCYLHNYPVVYRRYCTL